MALTEQQRQELLERLNRLEQQRQLLVSPPAAAQGQFAQGIPTALTQAQMAQFADGKSLQVGDATVKLQNGILQGTGLGYQNQSYAAKAGAEAMDIGAFMKEKLGIDYAANGGTDLVNAFKNGTLAKRLTESGATSLQAEQVIKFAGTMAETSQKVQTLDANVLKAQAEAETARAGMANAHLVEQFSSDYMSRSGSSNLAKLRGISEGNNGFGRVLSAAAMTAPGPRLDISG